MTSTTTESDQNQTTPEHTPEHLSELDRKRIDEQAKALSDRARKHRIYAVLVFGLLILPSIFAAIFVFFYAGEFIGRDLVFIEREIAQERFSLMEQIDFFTERKKTLTEHEKILTERKKTLTEHEKILTERKKTLTERKKTLTESPLMSLMKEEELAKLEAELAKLEAELAELEAELAKLEAELAELEAELARLDRSIKIRNLRLETMLQLRGENSRDDLPSFLHVSVTRFGTLGIIAFALTLFVSLYRNNIRLAVFYEARADALRIFLVDGISIYRQHIQILSDSMTPSVDFGKIPSTSVEHVTKLTEKVGSLFKK